MVGDHMILYTVARGCVLHVVHSMTAALRFINLLWPCTPESLIQICILFAEFARLIMSYKPGSHVTDNSESEWSEAGKSVFVAVSSFV